MTLKRMAVFWVVAPCSLAIGLVMDIASTSKTSVNFYRLHSAATRKTAIFIVAVMRNSNLTNQKQIFGSYG
jgi:hypothetical protein